MIISKIYDKIDIDGVILGILFGCISGVFLGSVSGIVYGLLWGIIFGVIFSFILGFGFEPGFDSYFVAGISFWSTCSFMVILINFSEAFSFINGVMPILFLIGGIIILTEALFWMFPKEKVKKKNLFKHTLKKKAEALFEVLSGLVIVTQIYILIKYIDFIKYLPEVLKWIGYIGAGIIVAGFIIGLFYLWIKLNSLKYIK